MIVCVQDSSSSKRRAGEHQLNLADRWFGSPAFKTTHALGVGESIKRVFDLVLSSDFAGGAGVVMADSGSETGVFLDTNFAERPKHPPAKAKGALLGTPLRS